MIYRKNLDHFPLVPTIVSIFSHFIFIYLLFLIGNYLNITSLSKIEFKTPTKLIQIEKISRDKLIKLRTKGKKDGKDYFNLPVEQQLQKLKGKQKLTLQALGAPQKFNKATIIRKKSNKKAKDEKRIFTYSRGTKLKHLNTRALQNLSVSHEDAVTLRNTGFNIKFTPPKGIKETELNSMEKIFYSFQKRTFQSYLSSFFRIYNQMLISQPYIKSFLTKDEHTLTGKVIFDREGNIISIKIIKWSDNDDVQKLFENTLREIKSLPNPPKAIIEESGQFVIYYQLKINK